MKVTVAVDLNQISKQQYIDELTASGSGDVARSLTVSTNSTPETIEVDVDNEEEFVQILTSNKVAGAQTDRLELAVKSDGSRSITPNTTSTVDITHHNWGLAAATQSSSTLATSYTYNNLGDGVDCVAMDTGVVVGHPEWNDQSNVSTRLNQINWGGSQGGSFYTDPSGHGTHVLGIMAGRTCGWAGDAEIYSFTTNLDGYTHGYNVSQMGLITTWHNAKSTDRPTIVNMSWGTSTYYPPNHPSHFITTAAWDPSNIPSSQYHMSRSSTYDTIIKNMVNAGIIVVASAGNSNQRIYDTNESGWDNGYWYYFDASNTQNYGTNEKIWVSNDTVTYDPSTSPRTDIVGHEGKTCYYQATNRGQSPSNAWIEEGTSTRHDISVQAHQSNKNKSSYSNYGTPLRTWAPGDYIMSAYINSGSAVQLGSTGYYFNKLNGTSMASPQVAGILATWLGKDPTTYGAVTTKANQVSAISFIEAYDRTDIVDWGDGLTNLTRVYTPHQDYQITWNLGHGSASHNIGSFSNGDNFAYDLSVTFRNAATEQLHDVSYNVTSGALPTNTSINSSGITSGTIGGYYGNQNPSFTLSATNGFDTETKDYTLSVAGDNALTVESITISGGVIIN